MKLPSASKLDRAMQCAASAVLPAIETDSKPAQRGRAVHHFLATGELPDDEELSDFCRSIDLDALPVQPDQFAAEVAFAYDLETGKARELGRLLDRNYPKTSESEMVGTADVVGLSPDGETVIVYDFKAGHSWLGKAAESWQLKFLALAAARAYGRDRATIGFIKIKSDGEPLFLTAELDAFELAATAVALSELMDRIFDPPPPRPGGWCRYCPSFQFCPAQTALIREMTWSPSVTAEEILAQLTPERAALAYQRLAQVREAMKRVDAALHAYAQENPIELPDGRVFGPVETKREVVVGDVAYRVLEQKYGAEVALAACEMSASKASVERALKTVAEKTGEKLAPLKRQVLDELRAAKGIDERVAVSVKEHTNKL